MRKNTYKTRENRDKNGIEITFEERPTKECCDALKQLLFRWSPYQRIWWRKSWGETCDAIESQLTQLGFPPEVVRVELAMPSQPIVDSPIPLADLMPQPRVTPKPVFSNAGRKYIPPAPVAKSIPF